MLDISQYEDVIWHEHRETGLRTFIAIHDTTRGPAIGGVRLWRYQTTQEALQDALRLSRAMTYKTAMARLPLGGGKSVILADGKEGDATIRAARLREFARVVKQLHGRYIAAEDIGTSVQDMLQIHQVTRHVVGLPLHHHGNRGSGDPSYFTAMGVIKAMQALIEDVFDTPSIAGRRIAIQGLGHVGQHLAEQLLREQAVVVGTDANPVVAQEIGQRLGIAIVAPEAIYDVPCDIFAPCAVGGVLNEHTIPRFTCKIIAGSANNQLDDETRDGDALHRRGILYGVDYIINAGGLINVAQELRHSDYSSNRSMNDIVALHDTMKDVLAIARNRHISTQRAAFQLANEILAQRQL